MNRMSLRAVVLTMLLATVPIVSLAQYKVQPNDTLWGLAGKNLEDASAWEKIYDANPFLKGPGRRFERNGKTIVVLHPGETLAGLDALGIVKEAPSVPNDQLNKEAPGAVKEVIAVVKTPDWFWWLVAALVLALVWLFGWYLPEKKSQERQRDHEAEADRDEAAAARIREERLNQDPVTSGPPMVPQGLTDATAPGHLQNMAARVYETQTGRKPVSIRLFEIVSSIPGRIWGVLYVRYANGSVEPHRHNGQRAYRAEVRFPDGNVETLYMLQGCGNDLLYGGIDRYEEAEGFRFEPDQPASAATSTEAPAEAASVPVNPVAQAAAVQPETVPEGTVHIEIRRAKEGQPAMVRMKGVDETTDHTIDIQPGEITIRYTPRAVK